MHYSLCFAKPSVLFDYFDPRMFTFRHALFSVRRMKTASQEIFLEIQTRLIKFFVVKSTFVVTLEVQ